MIIRVQSALHGTKRFEVQPSESFNTFFKKVLEQFECGGSSNNWVLFRSRDKSDKLAISSSKLLKQYNLRHGDMLYLHPNKIPTDNDGLVNPPPPGPDMSSVEISSSNKVDVVEDAVDTELFAQNGRIERERDPKFCRHGANAKCFHCSSLEPYDPEYLSKNEIKFLSFHSYLRKMHSGADKGKFVNLEDIRCTIKPGCTSHRPWPAGICSSCQPNAVTLNRQPYRHVDYVSFENPQVVDRFLNYWRSSGNQRIGIMYGYYEQHKDVPLGIKAVVAAIYEPPQTCSANHIQLASSDPQAEHVHELAVSLGLREVGWIFTDLIASPNGSPGPVQHCRGTVESHFLSAQECIMAATYQNKFPNPCKLSPNGYFGSKFVTVVVTGDKDNQISFEGYQVSNQCMSLVRDECFVPTKDVPELGYIRQSTSERYVPEVFYKLKDEYGNEVQSEARPLPVEYLLVDMSVGFPKQPLYTFLPNPNVTPFARENRLDVGVVQDFESLKSYYHQFDSEDHSDFLQFAADFHLLLFLKFNDAIPLKEVVGTLIDAVRMKDAALAQQWAKSEEWSTVETIMQYSSGSPRIIDEPMPMDSATSRPEPPPFPRYPDPVPPIQSSSSNPRWSCETCTFLNDSSRTTCEMCDSSRRNT